MVPDIEWGKNIRLVLDIGCTDSSFSASLLDKEVLALSLGLKDDLVDVAQVALERGFPAVVSPLGTRRLPFPSTAFDAIHCGGCGLSWHSNGLSFITFFSFPIFVFFFLYLFIKFSSLFLFIKLHFFFIKLLTEHSYYFFAFRG